MISADSSSRMKRNSSKLMTARQAVNLIPDNSTVTTGGFCGAGFAEELALEIRDNYLENNHPQNITLIYGAGQGDFKTKGLIMWLQSR
jgi:propionate CoA-transferase